MSEQAKTIGTAILGTGSSLQHFHHPSITLLPEKFNLVSIYERTPEGRLEGIVNVYNQNRVKVVRSLEEVLSDEEVELVVVSTPNTTHYEYTKAALKAGKHVLVEKPLCESESKATELYDLASKQGKVLCVYQNRRWDSDFLTLKSIIDSGKLGKLNEFTSSFDRYRPIPLKEKNWKETPGQANEGIYNLGSHLIDQAVVLFGTPKSVTSRTWDIRDVGMDESFQVDLHYPSHDIAPEIVTLKSSILSAVPEQQRFSIKGSRGSYIKKSLPSLHPSIKDLPSPVSHEGYGADPIEGWGTMIIATNTDQVDKTVFSSEQVPAVNGDYIALYDNLYESIRSDDQSKLVIKREEALAVLRIIELGMKSSKDGKVYSF